jgi:hypothetical protein
MSLSALRLVLYCGAHSRRQRTNCPPYRRTMSSLCPRSTRWLMTLHSTSLDPGLRRWHLRALPSSGTDVFRNISGPCYLDQSTIPSSRQNGTKRPGGYSQGSANKQVSMSPNDVSGGFLTATDPARAVWQHVVYSRNCCRRGIIRRMSRHGDKLGPEIESDVNSTTERVG